MPYIVVDTEGTGLQRLSRSQLTQPLSFAQRGSAVIQIGALVVDDNYKITKAVCGFCDTITAESEPGALRVHNLSLNDIRQKHSGISLSEVLMEGLPEYFMPEYVKVGYNVMFDIDLIQQSIRNFALMPAVKKWVGYQRPKGDNLVVDVMDSCKRVGAGSKSVYQKLVVAAAPYEKQVDELYQQVLGRVICNDKELFLGSNNGAHSALYDAVTTYVLWREKICRVWS